MINSQQLEYLLSKVPELKIGVLGDFCLDMYWALAPEAGEISIESNLPTTPVKQAFYSPGGAGNAVNNLRGIGVEKYFCSGAVGADPFGLWLRKNLQNSQNDSTAGLLTIDRNDYHTPVYCKPLLNAVEQSRFDLGNTPLNEAESCQICNLLTEHWANLDALIINEQLTNGLHSPFFRIKLAERLKNRPAGLTVIYDGRNYLDAYPGTLLKINAQAASMLAFGHSEGSPEESGRRILQKNHCELIVTDGANGCYVFEQNNTIHIPGIKVPPPLDTVGAGDSFTAGLACALAAGLPLTAAAGFGNMCSAVTVSKLQQTGAPTPLELRAIHSRQTQQ